MPDYKLWSSTIFREKLGGIVKAGSGQTFNKKNCMILSKKDIV